MCLKDLKPTAKPTLYELVRASGVDVSVWERPRGLPQTNPNYCFEWSFCEPGKTVVLTLWFRDLEEGADGSIRWTHGRALRPEEIAVVNAMENAPRRGNWQRRAAKFDNHVKMAWLGNLPIRAIVNEGDMGVIEARNERPARVRFRLLDDVPWYVTRYDEESGATIERGAKPKGFVDQWLPLEEEANDVPQRRLIERQEYQRSASVREQVLNRSSGFCEYCLQPGFMTVSGLAYLETHHIVPLADNGPDEISNVVALCANCHRKAHHAADRGERLARLRRLIESKF
jgi:hypothetical protein